MEPAAGRIRRIRCLTALLLGLAGTLAWAADGRPPDPPPSLPAELAAQQPDPGTETPLKIASLPSATTRRPLPPPPPPLELYGDAHTAVVVLAPAMVPEDAVLPPAARVFAILHVQSGPLPDGPAPAETRADKSLRGRVFEFTALPGTAESIDSSILQLPRVYRVAEVQMAPPAEPRRTAGSRGPPVRNASRTQPVSPAENTPPGDPRDPIVALGFKPISQVTTDTRVPLTPGVAADLQQPTGEAAQQFAQFGEYADLPRWGDIDLDPNLFLEPANFCHPPLYFEEINLERFGTSCAPRLQPVISGIRFFVTVPALPYLMTIQRPGQCYADLSPYRPGYPAPWHRELPPLRLDAAAVEAAALTGLIFAIP